MKRSRRGGVWWGIIKRLLFVLYILAFLALNYQVVRWADQASGLHLISAPSLDGFDPRDRAEAARLASKTYGGRK